MTSHDAIFINAWSSVNVKTQKIGYNIAFLAPHTYQHDQLAAFTASCPEEVYLKAKELKLDYGTKFGLVYTSQKGYTNIEFLISEDVKE